MCCLPDVSLTTDILVGIRMPLTKKHANRFVFIHPTYQCADILLQSGTPRCPNCTKPLWRTQGEYLWYAPRMGSTLDSTRFNSDEVDLEAFRARLRKMTDEELIREGKAGRYMCSPTANLGKPPRRPFVIQLEEVKAEWRRRHPK
jgi:hypothetical protein